MPYIDPRAFPFQRRFSPFGAQAQMPGPSPISQGRFNPFADAQPNSPFQASYPPIQNGRFNFGGPAPTMDGFSPNQVPVDPRPGSMGPWQPGPTPGEVQGGFAQAPVDPRPGQPAPLQPQTAGFADPLAAGGPPASSLGPWQGRAGFTGPSAPAQPLQPQTAGFGSTATPGQPAAPLQPQTAGFGATGPGAPPGYTVDPVTGLVVAGLNTVNQLFGSSSANNSLQNGFRQAQSTIQNASNNALGTFNTVNQQNQANLSPYTSAAGPTLKSLTDFNNGEQPPEAIAGLQNLNQNYQPPEAIGQIQNYNANYKNFDPTAAGLANNPDFQFVQKQGQQANERALAARGVSSDSGEFAEALDSYNTGLASQYENQYFNQYLQQGNQRFGDLSSTAGLEQNAQNSQFNNLYNTANAEQNAQNSQFQHLYGTAGLALNGTQSAVQANEQYGNQVGNTTMATAQDIASLQMAAAQAQAAGNTQQANAITSLLQNPLTGQAAQAALKGLGLLPGGSTSTNVPTLGTGGVDPSVESATNVPTLGTGGVDPSVESSGSTSSSGVGAGTAAGLAAAGAGGLSLAALTSGASVPAGVASVSIPAIGLGAGSAAAGAGTAGAAAGGEAAGAAGTAGAAGSTGGGLMGALGSLATNPITWGVAAAIAGGLIWKSTQVHPTADKFVQSFQNPFGKSLGGIVDGFDKAFQSGQLTKAQAQQVRGETSDLINHFMTQTQQFSQKGGKEKTVANQALRTMAQNFGGTQNPDGTWTPDWSRVLGKMDSEISGMQG